MNSSLSFSVNYDDKLLHENFFDENDKKSRIFQDVEKDLTEKLEVSDIALFFSSKIFSNYQNF